MGCAIHFIEGHINVPVNFSVISHHKGIAGRKLNFTYNLLVLTLNNFGYLSFGSFAMALRENHNLHRIAIHGIFQELRFHPHIFVL